MPESCGERRTRREEPGGRPPGSRPAARRRRAPTLLEDPEMLRLTLDGAPIQQLEERVDVRGLPRAVVHEVGVLEAVESDERRAVPDRVGVLLIADIIEEGPRVPVVRRPRPAARGDPRGPEVGLPAVERPERLLDQPEKLGARLPALPAEVVEVDLVVLDPSEGAGELDLEFAEFGVG